MFQPQKKQNGCQNHNIKKRTFWFMPFILIFILSILNVCSNSTNNDQIIRRIDQKGIEVVLNPESPKEMSVKYELEEIMSIGIDIGDENYMFQFLSDITVNNNEDIYTLDAGDCIVRIYNKNGLFVQSFGRKGEGPGELFQPSRIFLNSKNDIYIYDTGLGSRIIRFNSKGEYINQHKIGITRNLVSIDEENILYLTDREAWNLKSGTETKSFERMDASWNFLNTIVTLEGQNGTPKKDRSGMVTTGYESGSINYAIRTDGTLLVGKSSQYLFQVYDKSGKLIQKFGRKYSPISFSDEDKKRLHPSLFDLVGSTKPAFKISYFRFFVDDENNFWVRTYERENEGITFDIFDQEGTYTRQIFIECNERSFKPITYKKNTLYVIHNDQKGIAQVKLFQFKKM